MQLNSTETTLSDTQLEIPKSLPLTIRQLPQTLIQTIKSIYAAKGYIFEDDKLNIFGVRSNLRIPNSFDDFIYIVYKNKNGHVVFKQ